MKIRVIKKINEISGVSAVSGFAGGKSKKDLQELGQGGDTFGAVPYLDDAEQTFSGSCEREEHGPGFNKAINPRPTLHEDEEIDESMTHMLGWGIGGWDYAQGDDNPDDEIWGNTLRRSFERKGNRTLYPKGDIESRNAKYGLGESLGFSDESMDSIDREFFANKKGDLAQSEPVVIGPQEMAEKSLEEKGYVLEKELGKGMNGTVHLGKNKMSNACAIKIVIGDAAKREEENYRIINSVRQSHPLIEKHFPLVFESWLLGDKVAIIIMEVLKPLTNEQASFVPDASFLAAKNKPWRLAAAGDLYSNMRDMSKRFSLYMQNKTQEISNNFEYFVYQLTTDWDGEFLGKTSSEYVNKLKASVSPEQLMKLYKIGSSKNQAPINTYLQNRKRAFEQTLGAGSAAVHFVEILEEESPESLGVNAAFIEIAFQLMVAGIAAGQTKKKIDEIISDFAKRQLTSARMYTQIPLSYTPYELTRDDGGHEVSFTTSKGLHAAIKALYEETGLMAKDLHDQNIMSRNNGDLVIVDVGLFSKNSSWSQTKNIQEMRSFRRKMLRNLRK